MNAPSDKKPKIQVPAVWFLFVKLTFVVFLCVVFQGYLQTATKFSSNAALQVNSLVC